MKPTYTKLQIDTAGQTELLEQTGDQTMIAKQGETSFAIRDQDGTASTAVEQKWHMISAEQVGDSGSVIWQHAETGTFRETKYGIDETKKTWTRSGEAQELNTSELYAREGEHKADLNGDGFQSSSEVLLKGPGNQQQGPSEIMLEGDGLISSTNKVVAQWKADRNAEYSIEGKDKGLFEINNNGKVEFTGNTFAPDPNKAKGPTTYEFTVKATDKSTNQSTSQTIKIQQRHVIEVTNNFGDTREGSFGWAVQQANQLGAKNIASEIRFKESMTIQSENGYKLTHGDIKINTYDSKNISIKRTSNGSAFTIGEYKYANKHDFSNQPDLQVEASNINVFNTTAKGQDAAKNGGGGGGYGTGAGILHYNGHLTWSDSVFQGNKVEGGNGGDIAPKGANGGPKKREDIYNHVGWSSHMEKAKKGNPGLRGGGLNDRNHSFGDKQVEGGAPGKRDPNFFPSNWEGHHGKDGENAPNSSQLGEGGIGPANGGGGELPRGGDVFTGHGTLGNSGNPGQRGKSGYGGGQAAPGSGKVDDSDTREWGGTAGSKKGGSGGAQGPVISSLAHKNDKNSVTIRRIDALANEAESSSTAGKTENIHSRHLAINIDEYRQSQSKQATDIQRNRIKPGTYNTNPNVDRTNPFKDSAVFKQAEDEGPTNISINLNSFKINVNEANIVGRRIKLDPDKPHVIFTSMEMTTNYSASTQIKNWEKWRDGIGTMMDKIYAVRSEEEIKNSRRNFITKWLGFGAAVGSKSPDLFAGSAYYAGLGGVAIKGISALLSEFDETAKIQKELKNREQTIAEHEANKKYFNEQLKTDLFQVIDARTQNEVIDFKLGNHTNIFQPGVNPELKWMDKTDKEGRGIIWLQHNDFDSKNNENSAKVFQTYKMTAQQTKDMEHVREPSRYLGQFIVYKKDDSTGSTTATLANYSQWLTQRNNTQKSITGPGNDRVVINRNGEGGVSIHENIEIHTYEGDDIIEGDRGNSTLHAGVGNDYIKPGLGIDVVKGGAGRDTVDYSSISAPLKVRVSSDGNITVNFVDSKSKDTMNDTITDSEVFLLNENADIDLKGAHLPVHYSTVNPNRITNQKSNFAFSLKNGASFKGSDHDEQMVVDFEIQTGSSSEFKSIKEVFIDGRGGRNTAFIKGLDPLLSQGYNLHLDESKQELKLTNGSDSKTIVSYDNLMGGPKVYDKNDQKVELKSKASIAPSMDIDEELDLLTNYMASHEATTSASTRQLDTDQLILGTGGLAHSNAFESLTLEVTHQGVSLTQDPIKMILGDTSNSLEDGSNRHQQRDPLTQERMDNF